MINAAAEVPDTADREDIRGELHRIFDAPQFNHSPVMRRLLSFLVEQTLAGIGHRLKAYTIAVDALGRDADFDARIDSYPRVQVGRLRKLLDNFYDENGSAMGLRIHIPKGAYIVGFGKPGIVTVDGSVADGSIAGARARQIGPNAWFTKSFDLGRFAAAAIVVAIIGLFAWQALGGLARADIDKPRTQSSAETGERNEAYLRCVKVVAADRCRGMLARYDDPGAI